MRGMPGECAGKRSFVRNLRQSAQSQERVTMQTDESKRHVVRIRIGESGGRKYLGGRIRIPFDAPWPRYNAALVHEPVTPTQDGPQSPASRDRLHLQRHQYLDPCGL